LSIAEEGTAVDESIGSARVDVGEKGVEMLVEDTSG
jgi:hypothetical protein